MGLPFCEGEEGEGRRGRSVDRARDGPERCWPGGQAGHARWPCRRWSGRKGSSSGERPWLEMCGCERGGYGFEVRCRCGEGRREASTPSCGVGFEGRPFPRRHHAGCAQRWRAARPADRARQSPPPVSPRRWPALDWVSSTGLCIAPGKRNAPSSPFSGGGDKDPSGNLVGRAAGKQHLR